MADIVQLGKLWRSRARPGSRFAPYTLAALIGVALGFGYLGLTEGTAEPATAASFDLCGRPPHSDCVIDGDTFYLGSRSVRVADIDTPETHPPRCPYEAALGAQATGRLLQLLNDGPFQVERSGLRDTDRYGRLLRVVVRDGRSLGGVLVTEGLAREWTGRRQPWCG